MGLESHPPVPLGLLAELTHRCPLGCPYCSNPLDLTAAKDELDGATWTRVFNEAAALGALQVHLSGGEPASRRDLVDIVASAHNAGLYTNLITSGIGITDATVARLAAAKLDHVQISIQDSDPRSADRIAGYDGASLRKHELARQFVGVGIPLTINAVIHRGNTGHLAAMIDVAISLGATRIEIAHAQYYGWAIRNRAALMLTRQQAEQAVAEVELLRARHRGQIVIDAIVPDYHARFPKACVGGWGQKTLNVKPSGRVLPCHAAESIPDLEFWSVQEHSLADIWQNSPAFRVFRGTSWMQEPCRSCPRNGHDFGGCRCQAYLITGDSRAADPVCELSPHHHLIEELSGEQRDLPYEYRGRAHRKASEPAGGR
jgi:pyrroloquinoline quinone biosynthesis protein E